MTSDYHERHDELLRDPYDDSYGYDRLRQEEAALRDSYNPERELYFTGGLNPGRGWQQPEGEPALSGEQRAAWKLAKIAAGECFRCGSGRLDDTFTCRGCGKPARPESFQPKEDKAA